MSLESDVTETAFGCFSIACTLAGVEGTVVINRNVEILDENGQVIDRITMAEFPIAFGGSASHGDLLVADGVTYEIAREQINDGFIVGYEVHQR